MASPKDPHLQARPLSSPQESNRIDLKPAQSLPACSHTAHLHEVQGCLGCTVGWRRNASVLEGQFHLKVKNTGNCGINKELKSPCVMSMRIQIKGLKKQRWPFVWSIVWLTNVCTGLALQSVSMRKEPAPAQSGNLNLAAIWIRFLGSEDSSC